MDTDERRREIVRRMYLSGYVAARDLATGLEVDASTIRRDLDALARAGLLERTHGGARVPPGSADVPYAIKERERHAAKTAIGRAAAAVVHDGDTVILDSGSTVYEVAVALRDRRNLTVIANDLRIAGIVADIPMVRLIVPGGEQLTSNYALVADHAVSVVQKLRVEWMFLGADAVDLEAGITNTNTLEVPLKQAMIASARTVVLVADSSKFGRRALVRVADLDEVQRIVTDDELAPEVAARYGERLLLVPLRALVRASDSDASLVAS